MTGTEQLHLQVTGEESDAPPLFSSSDAVNGVRCQAARQSSSGLRRLRAQPQNSVPADVTLDKPFYVLLKRPFTSFVARFQQDIIMSACFGI